MTEKTKSTLAFFGGLILLILIGAYGLPARSQSEQVALRFHPSPPKLEYTDLRTGPLEVAKVFGRSAGCSDASPELIEITNAEAIRAGVDSRLVAATIAVESGCNPLAISNRGAVGLMQVLPRIWCEKYDCTKTYNYLNSDENIQVGTKILAGLIQQYGVTEGIKRYQGLGIGCETCDGMYTEKILKLAGRKR